MGYQQYDDEHVQDDEGNLYFSPFLPTSTPAPQTPGTGTNETPPSLPSAADPENQLPLPAPNKDFAVQPVQPTIKPQTMKDKKASEVAARNKQMTDDVTGFSAGGGVAKSEEDTARIAGGHALHREETAKAAAEAAEIAKRGEIAKNLTIADEINKTADEYDAHVNKIMADSKERWSDWKKRNDAAAASLIDPNHAMSNRSTLSKIGWALSFLSAGLGGGSQVEAVQKSLNDMIDRDIQAQRLNMENKRQGLEGEKSILVEQDKLGKDSVADWYAAKNLRLTAVGKSLDAQISQMGLPAAQKAGLLAARDIVEQEVMKTQAHVGDHFFEQGKQTAGFAHDIYMERLKSKLRLEEDKFKESLKKEDRGDTLPTNTQLGLQMVDKATGKPVEGGKVQLRVKGAEAVKAGQILAASNYEASQLRDAQSQLKGMSTLDIARGGTPEFASTVTELIQARAVRYNGHRLTDHDLSVTATEILGAPVTVNDGVISNMAKIIKQVGGTKEGMQRIFDKELRNLSTQTLNNLHPYIDSDTAEKYDIGYNIQTTNVPEQSKEPDDLNTALAKAGKGADVSDLAVPGARLPVTKDEAKYPPYVENTVYAREKAAGRGVQGGLPKIDPKEEETVESASQAFSHATADDIIRLSRAYLREKGLSEEAKHEIRLEAQEALVRANSVESDIVDEAKKKFTNNVDSSEAGQYINSDDLVRGPGGQYTPAFRQYLESDLVNEMRKRAGLEPRKR